MNQFAWCDETINGKYTKINDVYYATTAYLNDKYKIFRGVGDWSDWSSQPLTINTEYPISTVSFNSWLEESASKEHKVTLTIGTKTISTTPTNSNKVFNSLTNEDISIRTIKFDASRHSSGNKRIYIGDIYVYMAPHIILASGISQDYTFTNVEMGDAPDYSIDFHSFLSSTNGNITVSSSDPTNFKIRYNNSLSSDVVKIAGSNDFCSTTDSKGNFDIVFTPSEANTEKEATITIKDTGSNKSITITVRGTATKKTPTITWREEKVLVYGINYAENEIATSTCGTGLTFTSRNNDVISVENRYLIVNGEEGETAEIIVATTGDGTWASIKDTATFTVTRKQLQTITWEQNFLLLNTESQPITLNATVNSGKTITYTIADESIAYIEGGQLKVKGVVGGTTITAYVAGDDTYYEASMTKQIFVRQKTDNCNDIYAVYDPTTYSKSGWFNWDAIELSYDLATVGKYLSFEASSEGAATGESITITDQNGSTIYSSDNFTSASGIEISRSVTKINISAAANLSRSIKNIIVTPAIYLEPKKEQITFATIPITGTAEETIIVDWANQPDMMWATTDDEHFTVISNAIFGGTCGDYGSTEIKVKFDPSVGKNYTGNLLIGVGEDETPDLTIPLSATATKINHTLKWNDGIDNEIELNSIFNCNGKAFIVDDDKSHTIKYDFDPTFFYTLEEYPGYLYAIEEGETEITAYIEETETCAGADATFTVTILPEKATMTWEQNLSNFVEAESERVVTLEAESNKEGNIIYEIISNEDNIITLSGNTITIAAEKTGNAQIKAYNENYQDVYIIKNVIVASVAPCNTEIVHNISLTTDDLIVDAEEEVTHELTLEHSCKSVSFQAAITGGSLNSTSYGRITIITVVNDVEKEIFNKQFYDEGVNTSCDIDPQATKIIFKLYGYHVIGSVAGTIKATLTNVKTVLASDFNNYTTDEERFDFPTSSIGTSSKTEKLKINYWSLPGNINLSIESGNETATPFSVEPTILTDNCGIGEKTITVTLNPTIGGTFNDFLVIKTGGDEVIRKIPLTAIINKIDQAITWTTELLTTADRQVQLAKSNQGVLMNYEIVSGKEYASVENNYLDIPSVSVVNAGTFEVRAYNDGDNTYNAISDTKIFTSDIGTIRFDTDGDWNTTSNWLPVSDLNTQRNVAPSAVVNAEIAAEAEISSTNREEINDLTFVENGTLTIRATSGLKANAVTNATAENLILESSDKGNATFIYNSGTPSATVEMYSKATQGDTPEWQYMGVAVSGAKVSDFKKDGNQAWLLKWTEAKNTTGDPWSEAPLEAETELVPWAGYSISQPEATTYTTQGKLLHGDKEYTLSYTPSDDPDCGFNLLANSYTAPIDITKLTKDDFDNDNADACIVLYNTGTYGDWEKGQTDETNPEGQLTVIPVEAARAIAGDDVPTTIASMQAFFVMARENGATFTVDYQRAVAGATNHGNQMRAPEAQDEFNVLKIMIEGENSRDRLFLLENEKTTKAYDNGYEARKIFDAPRGHQMYATCQYGYASIDCSESFVGQTIGLKGDSEGEQLTISFDTEGLEGYSSLYLYDKVTGDYVNIIAGEEYTFYGIRGADDNRFTIVTNPDDRNQTPPFVVIGNELAFDKSQIGTDNANIYIYDAVGRLLMTDKVNPGENYRIPDMPEGIYLVSLNGYTTKIVKK